MCMTALSLEPYCCCDIGLRWMSSREGFVPRHKQWVSDIAFVTSDSSVCRDANWQGSSDVECYTCFFDEKKLTWLSVSPDHRWSKCDRGSVQTKKTIVNSQTRSVKWRGWCSVKSKSQDRSSVFHGPSIEWPPSSPFEFHVEVPQLPRALPSVRSDELLAGGLAADYGPT